MSGGSLGYKYQELEQLAEAIISRTDNALELAFADHILEVAKAAKALEWSYSGDSSEEKSHELIANILKKVT